MTFFLIGLAIGLALQYLAQKPAPKPATWWWIQREWRKGDRL